VRFRPTFWQSAYLFVFLAIVGVGQIVLRFTGPRPSVPDTLTPAEHHELFVFNIVAMSVALVLFTLGFLLNRRLGITLTPTEARVHKVRRRDIPWSEISGVAVETQFGTRYVVLYDAISGHTRLRAPITGLPIPDRRFEEKYHTIGQWWLAHHEQGGEPRA
jgi:hypothetical protein